MLANFPGSLFSKHSSNISHKMSYGMVENEAMMDDSSALVKTRFIKSLEISDLNVRL